MVDGQIFGPFQRQLCAKMVIFTTNWNRILSLLWIKTFNVHESFVLLFHRFNRYKVQAVTLILNELKSASLSPNKTAFLQAMTKDIKYPWRISLS